MIRWQILTLGSLSARWAGYAPNAPRLLKHTKGLAHNVLCDQSSIQDPAILVYSVFCPPSVQRLESLPIPVLPLSFGYFVKDRLFFPTELAPQKLFPNISCQEASDFYPFFLQYLLNAYFIL